MDKHWSRLMLDANPDQRRGAMGSKAHKSVDADRHHEEGHEWPARLSTEVAGSVPSFGDDMTFREARMRARVERNLHRSAQ